MGKKQWQDELSLSEVKDSYEIVSKAREDYLAAEQNFREIRASTLRICEEQSERVNVCMPSLFKNDGTTPLTAMSELKCGIANRYLHQKIEEEAASGTDISKN